MRQYKCRCCGKKFRVPDQVELWQDSSHSKFVHVCPFCHEAEFDLEDDEEDVTVEQH